MPRMMATALAALMLTGVVTGLSGFSAAVPNPVTPDLQVHIDEPTTVQATVTDQQKATVVFQGAVQVDKLPVERVTVVLAMAIDTGWAASITPSTIVITDTQAHPFSVCVVVPEATHADVVGHVKATASASGTSYSVTDEAGANVTVAPYYLVKLNSSAPYEEVLPGQMASFEVSVQNPGNAVDSYELEIENAKDLKNRGWSVELDKTTVSGLGPNGEAEVTVTAKPSQDWSWDLWISQPTSIVLKATSSGARNNNSVVTQSFPVIAFQKGYNMPLVNLISGITVALVALAIVGIIIWHRRRAKRRNAQTAKEPQI
jgi:hypothetical protein